MPELLLATNNQSKLREYRELLKNLKLELIASRQLGLSLNISETGSNFEENAIIKAKTYASKSGLLTLADDSGLEVDVLSGQPGVLTARYAGQEATDEDRVAYLLSKLQDIPLHARKACFRCVIAIATPEGRTELCSGECHGLITTEARGIHGFGYDPIFYLPRVGKTMAQLPPSVKNKLSHRAKAARKAVRLIRNLID